MFRFSKKDRLDLRKLSDCQINSQAIRVQHVTVLKDCVCFYAAWLIPVAMYKTRFLTPRVLNINFAKHVY